MPIELNNAAAPPLTFLRFASRKFNRIVYDIGAQTSLAARAFSFILRGRVDLKDLTQQLLFIGNRSLSIVFLISYFTGLVMALQFLVGLGRFGLKAYVGQLIGLAMFRELGPVLTSLMIAARVGSGIAAEIGSMVVTEQVLAIEAIGANPVQKLVVPRLLATLIATPLLVIVADVVGILGGMFISMREAGINARFYIDQIKNTVLIDDFVSGVAKSVFFGFFIAIIACYQGLRARGGTEGVGKATTHAVVYSSITIFISDFFLTKLILYF